MAHEPNLREGDILNSRWHTNLQHNDARIIKVDKNKNMYTIQYTQTGKIQIVSYNTLVTDFIVTPVYRG